MQLTIRKRPTKKTRSKLATEEMFRNRIWRNVITVKTFNYKNGLIRNKKASY